MGREALWARGAWRVAGEGLPRELGVVRRAAARSLALAHAGRRAEGGFAPVMRPLAGLDDAPTPRTRRARGVVEPGQPAPLLMRLMRHKTTLEPAGRKRERTREGRVARERAVGPAIVVAAAFGDHVRPVVPIVAPERVVAAPRGLRAVAVGVREGA